MLLTILPLLAFVFLTAYDQRKDAEENVERDVALLTRLVALDVAAAFDGMREVLVTLSGEEELLPGRERRCRAALRRLLPREPQYANLGVVRPDGTLTCAARPGAVRERRAARPAWLSRALRNRDFALGEFERDPETSEPLLTGALPVPGAEGRRVAFVSLRLAELRRLARAARLPGRSTLSVIDDSGTILARAPNPERFVGRDFRDRPLVRAALVEREGVTSLQGLDGVQRLYAFSRLAAPATESIVVSIGEAESDAYGPAADDLRRNLLLVGIVAIATLLASLVATHFLIVQPARRLAHAARRIGGGDLDTRAGPDVRAGELGEVARAFDEMAAALEQRQAELEASAMELRTTAEDRRALLTKLTAAEEESRRRIAADIHDDSAQALAAVGLRLDALADSGGNGNSELVEARDSIRAATQRLRRLMFELRPPVLDAEGLGPALEAYLAEAANQDGFRYEVDDRTKRDPRPDTRAIMYRIALEALSNVRKHAQASRVVVSIESRDQGLSLEVEDDGAGFSPPPPGEGVPGHYGLVTMEERARAAGGSWRIASSPEGGTTVTCWLPDRTLRSASG